MKTMRFYEAKEFWENEAQRRPMSFRTKVTEWTVIPDLGVFGVVPCVHTAKGFKVTDSGAITVKPGIIGLFLPQD